MANLTVSNMNAALRTGNVERIMDHGTQIETPESFSTRIPQPAIGTEKTNLGSTANTEAPSGESFGDLMKKSLEKVNQIQLQADHAARELAVGRNKNIHETMLMLEKADISFRLLMQVRNKIIDAYREVMRMQV